MIGGLPPARSRPSAGLEATKATLLQSTPADLEDHPKPLRRSERNILGWTKLLLPPYRPQVSHVEAKQGECLQQPQIVLSEAPPPPPREPPYWKPPFLSPAQNQGRQGVVGRKLGEIAYLHSPRSHMNLSHLESRSATLLRRPLRTCTTVCLPPPPRFSHALSVLYSTAVA